MIFRGVAKNHQPVIIVFPGDLAGFKDMGAFEILFLVLSDIFLTELDPWEACEFKKWPGTVGLAVLL